MATTRDAAATARTYILVLLGLVSLLNFVDRQILTILLEAVKKDLGVGDAAMGFLSGTTFAVFYAAASMPIARWADVGNRRSILAGAVAIWSAATALCGLASSFAYLAVARAGVAVAESAAVPISHSLAANLFPAQRRATVFGILMAAGSIGIAAGLFLGGWANTAFGWRSAFVVVGLPGLGVALLLRFTMAEPARTVDAVGSAAAQNASDLLRDPLYRSLLLLAALGSLLTYALLGWAPTFMIRLHGMTTAAIGLRIGLATGIGNALGHYLAGAVSDRMAARDLRWYARLPAIASVLAVPPGLVFLRAADASTAILAYAVLVFFMSIWLMPLYALAYRVAGPRSWARASAMIALTMSLVGLGLGPLSVGALTDALSSTLGAGAIRASLSVVVFLNIALALGFVAAMGQIRRLDAAIRPAR